MVEIEATKMLHRGTISLEERESIANGSGHCLSSTVRDFYQREDRIADMRNSRSLFQHLRVDESPTRPHSRERDVETRASNESDSTERSVAYN